jgi:ADP-heptose:LPS heptosyltransferase
VIFLPSGLGDALLHIPLIRELKKEGNEVTGIFSSSQTAQLFKGSDIFKKIIIAGSRLEYVFIMLRYIRHFKKAYLNTFASTRKNIFLAFFIAEKIVTNKKIASIPAIIKGKITFINPRYPVHDSVQNILLANENWKGTLSEKDFSLSSRTYSLIEGIKKPYVAVQISAGNNINTFKNWPVAHWIDLLKIASEIFPEFTWVLMGEPAERSIAETIMNNKINNVISFVGKTSVEETIPLIANSDFFLGLDGGLMHLAFCLGKPTFTLWGPSDFNLYGYQEINPAKNKVIFREISCRPCNSWIMPNRTRVSDPRECPDFACMQLLQPIKVFEQLEKFIKEKGSYA